MQRQCWKESWAVGTWGSGMGAAMQGSEGIRHDRPAQKSIYRYW